MFLLFIFILEAMIKLICLVKALNPIPVVLDFKKLMDFKKGSDMLRNQLYLNNDNN